MIQAWSLNKWKEMEVRIAVVGERDPAIARVYIFVKQAPHHLDGAD